MTDWKRIEDRLREVAPDCVQRDVLLSDYTSYKIGGMSRLFVAPDNEAMVGDVLSVLNDEGITPFVLGGGSNVLIADSGWDGVTMHLGQNLSGWEFSGRVAEVMAGTTLLDFIREAVRQGLGGMEQMAGIPGNVGGALRMNAGAFGQEVESTVQKVRGFLPDGEPVAFGRAVIDFGYRSAPELQDVIITSARFSFERGDESELQQKVEDVLRLRAEKQPLEYPSCGSVFKRPPGHYAGALIEDVEMKGTVHGKAQVSARHAGFIVNLGGATATEVRDLMDMVADKVKAAHGVELQREVKLIGFEDARE